MDINQVIEMGEKIPDPSLSLLNIEISIAVLFFGVFICLIGLFMFGSAATTLGMVIFIIAGGFLFNGLYQDWTSKNTYGEQVEKWKNEVVAPYIETLPKEKREIVYIKIESELSSKTNRLYTYSSPEIKLTPLTVSFKEGRITTLTNWYDASMELTKEEKAYVEFQKVPKDLGHGMDAGYYNLSVHLPETYTFTEIK
ncbi:hypothetical protein ACFVS2_25830 [Brevibacillus sp. NPDC058079]|uniref:hypothetical protein n=1 Tax=Brevibacillus sp. NPDC058079 TaxID=3346330 RepID=UPI0036EF61DE